MRTFKWLTLILTLTVLVGALLFSTVGAKDPDDDKLMPPTTEQMPSGY